jgi:hypothetical protein
MVQQQQMICGSAPADEWLMALTAVLGVAEMPLETFSAVVWANGVAWHFG